MNYFLKNLYSRFSLLLILAAVVMGSCQKLIEIPANPTDKISTERIYSDSLNIMSAMAGIYANFKAGGNSPTIVSGLLSAYPALSADEFETPSDNLELTEFHNNNLLPNNNTVNEIWTSGYFGIYQVNAFIEGVAGSTRIGPAFKNQLTGEALVTRALYYFNLVNVFGPVPIVTGTDYKVNAIKPRSSADSVYTLILSDLTRAEELLTDKYPSEGRARPNRDAARALLARVYLYRGQWKQASDMATMLISSGRYQLPEVGEVFKRITSGKNEAIWQVIALTDFGQTAEATLFVPYPGYVPNFTISQSLRDAFEDGDKREEQWVTPHDVDGINYYYPSKYRNTAQESPREDYMIFRLGEQYLIRAEALAQQNLLDDARADINALRERAGLNPTLATTKEEVLKAVAHERQTELCFEWGHRWFDLNRTGQANVVLPVIKPGWQSSDALYPVPFDQLKTNVYLKQNPGYN